MVLEHPTNIIEARQPNTRKSLIVIGVYNIVHCEINRHIRVEGDDAL
jgi:hypothetical protein